VDYRLADTISAIPKHSFARHSACRPCVRLFHAIPTPITETRSLKAQDFLSEFFTLQTKVQQRFSGFKTKLINETMG
jgi:hypothetical protein